jgi:hypothetical protein
VCSPPCLDVRARAFAPSGTVARGARGGGRQRVVVSSARAGTRISGCCPRADRGR